ncbi:hypothetical protein [Actinobaculum sp. 352]|uniref:hypothetical protein n=1 Tax=Actinobaculum sp. 352 TaxID=2490946 RepID=UPI0013DF4B3F|nr:hypothetical protein [Actinobaculum sp. 352]
MNPGDYVAYWRGMEKPRQQLVRDLIPYSPEDPTLLIELIRAIRGLRFKPWSGAF